MRAILMKRSGARRRPGAASLRPDIDLGAPRRRRAPDRSRREPLLASPVEGESMHAPEGAEIGVKRLPAAGLSLAPKPPAYGWDRAWTRAQPSNWRQ